jgi:hypothetical protein
VLLSPKGYPYADPTDRVRDWPATSQALATTLDARAPSAAANVVWGTAFDPTVPVYTYLARLAVVSDTNGLFALTPPVAMRNVLGLAYMQAAAGTINYLVYHRSDLTVSTRVQLRTMAIGTGAAMPSVNLNINASLWYQPA